MIDQKLIDYIVSKDLTIIDRENFILQVTDKNFIRQRILIFSGIESIVTDKPQEFVDQLRKELRTNPNLIYLLRSILESKKNKNSAYDPKQIMSKIRMVSNFWEVLPLFKPFAVLLSRGKLDYNLTKEKNQILKQFKFIGISNTDINQIRKIRNSDFHPFTFQNGFLINDKNEQVVEIEYLSEIIKKIEQLFKFIISSFLSSIIYNTVFLSLISFVIYDEFFRDEENYNLKPPKNNLEKVL